MTFRWDQLKMMWRGIVKRGDARMRALYRRGVNKFIYSWNLPVLMLGFLLGRALILDVMAPFAVPYLAVVYQLSHRHWKGTALALAAGATTVSTIHGLWMTGMLLLLLIVQKVFYWSGLKQLNHLPFAVLITMGGGYLVRLWQGNWTAYEGILAGIDVMLGFVLTLVFIQAVPALTAMRKPYVLRNEEIVCMVILIGSAITGLLDWTIGDLSVAHMVSRLLIMTLALSGGGLLGATIGVVMGVVLSLSDPQSIQQISILAFAGLLAGLLREGKRFGVAFGFLLGTSILAFYDGGIQEMGVSLMETGIAIALFLILPGSFLRWLSRFVPGTEENNALQQSYARRLREITAAKVEQFSELFAELSRSFQADPNGLRREEESHMNQFISNVMEKSCGQCRLYRQCWEKNFLKSYQGMSDLMTLVELKGPEAKIRPPRSWTEHCIQPEKVLSLIREGYAFYEQDLLWRDRLRQTRHLVSDQLDGLSEVMTDLSRQIRQETQTMTVQEEQIHQALEELGLSIQRVEVLDLEEGKVEIEITLPHNDALDECRKLVAPLLTEILGEPIAVHRKEVQGRTSGSVVTLGSAQRFEVRTGVAGAAKGGQWLSGDSYCYMNMGGGKYAIAISDGMGNGHRAQQESHAALQLLRRLLTAGMNEEKAVQTVNAILGLRSTDEMFATIDLAMIDLNTAKARFLKIGSTPGWIKRGEEVIMLAAENPPVGILKEVEVEPVESQLAPGDLLIMVTDGIYDAPKHTANKEAYMKRLVSEIDTQDPQAFADLLLEKVIRQHNGQIDDDMTVIVAKVERYTPEWATIRMPGMPHIQRPQVAGL